MHSQMVESYYSNQLQMCDGINRWCFPECLCFFVLLELNLGTIYSLIALLITLFGDMLLWEK